MEIIHTRNRAVAWGVLLSALVVGVVLTLGQVPLAVSQPVAIQAKMIKGPIPMDGANPLWENVPGVVVPLTGQTITTPMHPNIAVKSVFVKAVTNGKDIGIRLDWGDQSKNDTTIGPQHFRDQAAIQFPVNTSGAPPFPCMGQSRGTANICVWEHSGSLKGGCCTGPTWRVVYKRALQTQDPNDVQFKLGMSVPVAFAVWDGQNVERDGMKAISTWFTLHLPQ